MNSIINLGIPHVGEQIFQSIGTDELVQCLAVSQSWKILIEGVLFQRWKGKIIKACKNGITEVVRILLEHSKEESVADINSKNMFGRDGFLLACKNGHHNIVKFLLNFSDREKINFDTEDFFGETALTCGHVEVVKVFLDHPATEGKINQKNQHGWNGFMQACRSGQLEVAHLLLENSERKNIEINARSKSGSTAFMLAC